MGAEATDCLRTHLHAKAAVFPLERPVGNRAITTVRSRRQPNFRR
jgi:hypothetical protein